MRGIVSVISSGVRSRHRGFDIKVVWGQANAKEGHRCSQMGLMVPTWQRNVDAIRHTHLANVGSLAKIFEANLVVYNITWTYLSREKQ
jgi:hypothetical protein